VNIQGTDTLRASSKPLKALTNPTRRFNIHKGMPPFVKMVVTINKSRTNQKPKLILRGCPPSYNNDENLVDHDAYFDTHEPYISPYSLPPTSLSSQEYEEIQELRHIYDDHYPQDHSYHPNTTQDFPSMPSTSQYYNPTQVSTSTSINPQVLQLQQLAQSLQQETYLRFQLAQLSQLSSQFQHPTTSTPQLYESSPSTSYKSLSQPIYHSYQPNSSIPQTYSTITLPQTSQVQIPTHASPSHIPNPLTSYLQQKIQQK